jgi:glutaredoxin-like protein
MTQSDVTIYGADWCGDCRRAKRFLEQHKVAYTWIDVERDPGAMERVKQLNNGMHSIPVLIFTDGSRLVEPSNAQLGQKLGI